MTHEIHVHFPDVSPTQAGEFTRDLERHLSKYVDPTTMDRVQSHPHAMDIGSILHVVLTSAAVTVVARGIAEWIALHRGVELSITHGDTFVSAKNLTSSDSVEAIESVLSTRSTE